MDNNQNGVVAYCIAYNHERYIRKTLEGFVAQRTTFPFRVIVHDDASTDATKSIIEEYVRDYPDLFVPIYQTENQYSKGVSIYANYISPLLNEKYIACCEGDDYWCSDDKLQKQFDYMENHPECPLCVHNSRIITEDGLLTDEWFNYSLDERDYSIDEIIMARGGGLFHTSSFFVRGTVKRMDPAFIVPGIGDYNYAIFLASKGSVHYFPETMSCYRTGSVNSWVKSQHADTTRIVNFNKHLIEGLYRIGVSLNGEHDYAIKSTINQYKLSNFFYTHKKSHIIVEPQFWIPYIKRKTQTLYREYQRSVFVKKEEMKGKLCQTS